MFQRHDADSGTNWSDMEWQIFFALSNTERCLNNQKSNSSTILNSLIKPLFGIQHTCVYFMIIVLRVFCR